MSIIGIVPARMAASRFPGKPLHPILGRPMIEHVYRRVAAAPEVRSVIVATDDLRIAMESTSGRNLERFFERWIYNATLPSATLATRVENGPNGPRLAIRVEQKQQEVFDFPLTLTLSYSDRPAATVTIPISDRVTETTVPLAGTLRDAEVDRNDGLLADIQRVGT